MEPPATHHRAWKAPSEDGQILIWPEPAEAIGDSIDNHKRLETAEVRLQGIPLRDVRRIARRAIGHEDDRLLILTAHQSELYHAGVWAKNAMIGALAERVEGRGMHLSVDTDAPKHLQIRWPGGSMPLSDDPRLNGAAWTGLLPPPTEAHLDRVLQQLMEEAAGWGCRPAAIDVVESLRQPAKTGPTLPAVLAEALHELDQTLGLRHEVRLASPIWEGEAFGLFVHDLLGRAAEVASGYNSALAEYRAANGIRSVTRPMPDLLASDQAVEIPFWLDDLHTRKRSRPSLFQREGGWVLKLLDGDEFVFDARTEGWESARRLRKWLDATRHRLSPRALMLTMFCRLVVADQFVHGIGGARYDQVTDRMSGRLYGIEPPRFAVTTATLYFPAALGRQRVCLPCVKQEGHRLKHGLLGERKRELVGQIAALPRRSQQRAEKFQAMHDELEEVAAKSDVMSDWQERMKSSMSTHREDEAVFDRELFYGMQPRERLAGLIERYEEL